jgi:hypothetical protein
MKQDPTTTRIYLYRIAVIILVVGLISSVLIYFIAKDLPDEDASYGSGGGSVSYLSPEDSKRTVREMEQFGGKASVAVYKFQLWFAGLWHGKSLAFTVAFISLFLAYCFRFVADRMTSGVDPDKSDGNKEADDEKH